MLTAVIRTLTWCLSLYVDTEEIKRPSHVDDGVPGLWLCPRSKLDDLLGSLEELRHSRPWTAGSRTLEHKKGHDREFESHSGKKAGVPVMTEDFDNSNKA